MTGLTQAQPRPKSTVSDVLAVFRAHCVSCHGSEQAAAGLRLDSAGALRKGGSGGRLVVPGKPASSLLVKRMKGIGGAQMPLGFAPLSPEKQRIVEQWILAGASFTEPKKAVHWAYVAPTRPAVPAVKNAAWVRNPIDQFILAKLESLGIKPSPAAPISTLLRRVHLDATGLLPSPSEVDAYLAEENPAKFEAVVDRLLASDAYGERLALMWLDLARYADSNGYEKDANRQIWAYRDYVIRAFANDMPFDRFTREQLAGDLLPNPTQDQLVATGFHRNTMMNEEGGVDKAEQRWLRLVDIVGTTGTTWLATSMACAQCHDHKYDPVRQADFYQMLAFWEPADEATLDLSPAEAQALLKEAAEVEKSLPGLKENKDALAAATARLNDLRKRAGELGAGRSTLVFREAANSPVAKTPMRLKGAFLSPGEMLVANSPQFLGPLPGGAKPDRLALANWLTSRRNPLTARVMVNRLWELVFGEGLVRTSEDFGTQGEVPVHRELLDWLAVEFMDSGWRIRPMLKMMLTSSTYRQSSMARADLKDRDPENRWLARGPRHRLAAELLRDANLCASGLLDRTVGGPSVYPPQPEGVWDVPYSGERWLTSEGGARYRRGLYTFMKRSSPYPAFMAFDAGSRESCLPRRIRSQSPAQALILLNDTAYVEMARGLAARMMAVGRPWERQLEQGFRAVLIRRPTAAETGVLKQMFDQALARFQRNPQAAAKLFPGEGDRSSAAAWVVVAQVVMNLDEAVTKE